MKFFPICLVVISIFCFLGEAKLLGPKKVQLKDVVRYLNAKDVKRQIIKQHPELAPAEILRINSFHVSALK